MTEKKALENKQNEEIKMKKRLDLLSRQRSSGIKEIREEEHLDWTRWHSALQAPCWHMCGLHLCVSAYTTSLHSLLRIQQHVHSTYSVPETMLDAGKSALAIHGPCPYGYYPVGEARWNKDLCICDYNVGKGDVEGAWLGLWPSWRGQEKLLEALVI